MKRLLGLRWLGHRSTPARVVLGLCAFFGWFACVLYWSERQAAPEAEQPRLHAVAELEPVVLAVAANGLGQLSAHDARARLQQSAHEPALMALFGAWAKLSLGRLGILGPTTCARLPWLVLCALGPALLYRALRPLRGALVALVAAATLAFLLLRDGAGVAQREATSAIGWLLLVLTAYLSTLQPALSARQRQCSAVSAALALGVAVALDRSALWAAVICMLHLAAARWAATRRSARRGHFPLPSFVFLGLPLAIPLLVLLNPPVWQATPVQIAGFVLGPLGAGPPPEAAAGTPAWPFVPVVLAIGALLGLLLEMAARHARGSWFKRAPGSRDFSAVVRLLAVGFAVTWLAPWLLRGPLAALAPAPAGAWPFWAIAVALGAGAGRDLALGAFRARSRAAAPPQST